jgi:hypothetical protein
MILSDVESLTRDRRKESVATITDVIAPDCRRTRAAILVK